VTAPQTWPAWRRAELGKARRNGRVGSTLVSETEDVRVWLIDLAPGERLPFHCHVLNYFWTATSEGAARSHYSDGRIAESVYKPGDTRHYRFGSGESMIHDLENTGPSRLTFTTVELKIGSSNSPLILE
jgi:beta-alanine degradation protein BauB